MLLLLLTFLRSKVVVVPVVLTRVWCASGTEAKNYSPFFTIILMLLLLLSFVVSYGGVCLRESFFQLKRFPANLTAKLVRSYRKEAHKIKLNLNCAEANERLVLLYRWGWYAVLRR